MLARTEEPSELQTINKRIGARIRALRRARKMSQQDMGDILGVSFQQIQKYENGGNRLSAASLVVLAMAMNFDMAEMLDGFALGDFPPVPHELDDWLQSPEGAEAASILAPLPRDTQAGILRALRAMVEFATAPNTAPRTGAGAEPKV